ncbi:HD-GYP domain-containing protein [Bacillus solitudinis]|uniref:HD-GYP domain-containing protein n=1 Tax=Bacillus solitudinis TaxID=2014074 RepID=UPI000C23079B|nr:HD-GYP domain-containing protein [Bacillus solitudinis]
MNEKKKLLSAYVIKHQNKLAQNIFNIIILYLSISLIWNVIFLHFQLPFSRADIPYLAGCLLVILTLRNYFKYIPSRLQPHVLISYSILLITCLYFTSGYGESWSYFLLVPLIVSLFCNRKLLISYSLIGLIVFFTISFLFPSILYPVDGVDISNRILLYIIVTSFSYVLFNKLIELYNQQVNIVVESLETTLEQTVKSFVISIEAKDQYTFGHSERVSTYSVEIGRSLKEYHEKHNLNRLKLSGLVHDIGKINIPENILTTPDKLTDEEFEIIKTHPIVGARMVERVTGLEFLTHGVLYHHERWDGEGYPRGLKGEDIPLDARVLAIADAFDAMTSNRAYRDALSFEEAINLIKEGSGTQFDPNLIQYLDTFKPRLKKVYDLSNSSLEEFERVTDFL